MKLIIAGSRTFTNLDYAHEAFHAVTDNEYDQIEIISGGADAIGEQIAELMGLELLMYPADWAKHGKAAGPIRNKQMAEAADAALIFWDGKSKGTLSLMSEMAKLKKPFTVYGF